METKSTGLLPLHSFTDKLRAAGEKMPNHFVLDQRWDTEEEAEKYHRLYAPPYIPVRSWLKIRQYLPDPRVPLRKWVADRLLSTARRISMFSLRVRNG